MGTANFLLLQRPVNGSGKNGTWTHPLILALLGGFGEGGQEDMGEKSLGE
jgi:hypothetical protein